MEIKPKHRDAAYALSIGSVFIALFIVTLLIKRFEFAPKELFTQSPLPFTKYSVIYSAQSLSSVIPFIIAVFSISAIFDANRRKPLETVIICVLSALILSAAYFAAVTAGEAAKLIGQNVFSDEEIFALSTIKEFLLSALILFIYAYVSITFVSIVRLYLMNRKNRMAIGLGSLAIITIVYFFLVVLTMWEWVILVCGAICVINTVVLLIHAGRNNKNA